MSLSPSEIPPAFPGDVAAAAAAAVAVVAAVAVATVVIIFSGSYSVS